MLFFKFFLGTVFVLVVCFFLTLFIVRITTPYIYKYHIVSPQGIYDFDSYHYLSGALSGCIISDDLILAYLEHLPICPPFEISSNR